MKQTVDAFDYAGQICKAMKKGILLTTCAGEKVNTMTIGWGKIGIEWGKPIFIAYVRQSRHTRQMLDESGEFTVNIPLGAADPKALGLCGTKSGRDTDKIAEAGLTLEPGEAVSVPGIRQFPLTLECKIIYRQEQDLAAIPAAILDRYYPQDVDGSHPGSNRDHHIAYYGEIVNSYIITE